MRDYSANTGGGNVCRRWRVLYRVAPLGGYIHLLRNSCDGGIGITSFQVWRRPNVFAHFIVTKSAITSAHRLNYPFGIFSPTKSHCIFYSSPFHIIGDSSPIETSAPSCIYRLYQPSVYLCVGHSGRRIRMVNAGVIVLRCVQLVRSVYFIAP